MTADTFPCRLIAKGASGGRGRLSSKTSHGAVVRVIVKLERGEQVRELSTLHLTPNVSVVLPGGPGGRVCLRD